MAIVCTAGNVSGAYRILRERGCITSLSTLYGGKRTLSILARAANSGYVNREGKLAGIAAGRSINVCFFLGNIKFLSGKHNIRYWETKCRHVKEPFGDLSSIP